MVCSFPMFCVVTDFLEQFVNTHLSRAGIVEGRCSLRNTSSLLLL